MTHLYALLSWNLAHHSIGGSPGLEILGPPFSALEQRPYGCVQEWFGHALGRPLRISGIS